MFFQRKRKITQPYERKRTGGLAEAEEKENQRRAGGRETRKCTRTNEEPRSQNVTFRKVKVV